LDEKEKVIKKSDNNKERSQFLPFFAKIECFQSDLTEAFAKLNQVPLALIHSDENPDKNFLYIYIRKAGIHIYSFTIYCLKLKNRLENVGDHLRIKLPILPSTIEELALIRFWLLKLSQANFEYFVRHITA
jgi:hypothetical protein